MNAQEDLLSSCWEDSSRINRSPIEAMRMEFTTLYRWIFFCLLHIHHTLAGQGEWSSLATVLRTNPRVSSLNSSREFIAPI